MTTPQQRAMLARRMSSTGRRNMGHIDLPPLRHVVITRSLAGCGCGTFGALGASALEGQLASKGAGILATTAVTSSIGAAAIGSALAAVGAGAAAGSVVPIVGTVIGAVVGYLTSKLFGHADYAVVYANIQNIQALFQAYMQVAGEYPGRVYGWPEMQYIFHGALVYGLFPGNGPSVEGSCTEAMISSNINACGNGGYIDDWLGVGKASGDEPAGGPGEPPPKPGSGNNNCVNLIGTAIKNGVFSPITIASQYLVPGAEAVAAGKNNSWISVKNSRNPSLYTQMLVDLANVIEFGANPKLPVYYGSIPGQAATPAPASSTPAPVADAPAVAAVNTQAAPAQGLTAAQLSAQVTAEEAAAAAAAAGTPAASQVAAAPTTAATATTSTTAAPSVAVPATTPAPASATNLPSGITEVGQDQGGNPVYQQASTGLLYEIENGSFTQWSGTLVNSTIPMPAGYTEVGTNVNGNPVYENASGVLYEWNGVAMTQYTGTLANGSTAQNLTALLQQYLAQGQTQSQALTSALSTLQSQGVQATPDLEDYGAGQVAAAAAAPTVVAAPSVDTSKVLLLVGGLAVAGVLAYALTKKRR